MTVTIFVNGEAKKITDAQWAEMASPPADVPAYTLYKTDVTGRMTDKELDAFDAALSAASTRERRLWADCTRLVSDDPYFAALHARLTEAFSQTRADAILAAP